MADILREQIEELGLGRYRDFLLNNSKLSIELIPAEWNSITDGCSKLGGHPDVPGDFEWPQHAFGPYRFIAQINLAELPKNTSGLPSSGMLAFFYAHDEGGENFWQDPGYVRAFYFSAIDKLQSLQSPQNVDIGGSCAIEFEIGADVPPWPWNDADLRSWPIDESRRNDYWALRSDLHHGAGFLFGFPFTTTLAYDPTPGPDWTSFLTLRSDDELEWCWHDGDWLVTFIEKLNLQNGNFTEIKSDAG